MASQEELKRRLNVLMKKPENMICSDCPERQPRWASLIVPPPGSPPGSLPIGAFCCLECSGSHRRLGVHISFVRSVNLDSWKEKEVLAMENGGNAKVNAIFEAHLSRSGSDKPTNQASGPTRERFIRDKYERRKFYDASVMEQYYNGEISPDDEEEGEDTSTGRRPLRAPSDAARKRAEARKARNTVAAPKRSPKKPAAPAPPVQSDVVDLLDFGCEPSPSPTPSPPQVDPFAPRLDPFISAPPPPLAPPPPPTSSSNGEMTFAKVPGMNFANFTDPFAVETIHTTTTNKVEVEIVQETTTATNHTTTTSITTENKTMNNDDILKLFNQPGAGGLGGVGVTSNNAIGTSPPMDAFSGLGAMTHHQGAVTNGGLMHMPNTGLGSPNMMMNPMTKNLPNAGPNQPSIQQQQYLIQQQMLLMQQQQQMQMMMKQMNFGNFTADPNHSTQWSSIQQQQQQNSTSTMYNGTGFGGMAPMGGTTQYNQNTGGGIAISQLNMMNRLHVNSVNLSGGPAVGGNGYTHNNNNVPKMEDQFSGLSRFGS